MGDLALQVGQRDDVVVHDPDGADAGGCEIQRDRAAEPAGADHQDLGAKQPLLPDPAHLLQHDVPGVALDLLVGEVHDRLVAVGRFSRCDIPMRWSV